MQLYDTMGDNVGDNVGGEASAAKRARQDPTSRSMTWWTKYTLLKAYTDKHGHLPPQRGVIGDFMVGQWIHTQCQAKKSGCRLSPSRVQALEALPGWLWVQDPVTVWNKKFAQLEAYVAEHKHLPTQRTVIGSFKIGQWVGSQRKAKRGYAAHRITADQIQALETIPGWYWGQKPDTTWREMFDILKAYVDKHQCLPATSLSVGGFRIGKWVERQRQAKQGLNGRQITAEQIQTLEGLPGWQWEHVADDAAWHEKFDKLRTYIAEHGHPPARYETVGAFRVGQWVHRQLQALRQGNRCWISAEQERILRGLPPEG
jgi:hypothetical protein